MEIAYCLLAGHCSPQDTDHASLPYQELPPDVYRLSNGYLPRPLDLEAVQLEPGLLELVDKLAENAHNVWAAGRITQGWTYGMASVSRTGVSVATCIHCSVWLPGY